MITECRFDFHGRRSKQQHLDGSMYVGCLGSNTVRYGNGTAETKVDDRLDW